MKRIVITSITIFIAGTLGISTLVQAKGSRSSSYKSYNTTPKENNVSGYSRKDGTYVAPHHRSNRDGARNNNWTTQGNTNPHTGKDGTAPRSDYEKAK
ncbi:hypothetical protein [Simplicispira psychrophila]|uniref:hypothetical protein n=1 Tax=Simplicispira psychrophila TaxID=80882 RepID=UPI00055D6445|nr:hypothetical protein [Simplicispira psychrophila]